MILGKLKSILTKLFRAQPLLFCVIVTLVVILMATISWRIVARNTATHTGNDATSSTSQSQTGDTPSNGSTGTTENKPEDGTKPTDPAKPGETASNAGGSTTNPKSGSSGSGTSGGSAGGGTPSTPTTPTPPSTPTPSYPNASNTGPSGCSSYTNSGTLNITTDGTVLSCVNLTGTLYINANNVTIQNSILTGTSWWGIRYGNTKANATGLKVLHSKLQTVPGQGPDNGGYDYGIAQEASGSMEIAYNNISGYKDGITASRDAYIHDNYIHDLSEFTGSHSQGIYVYAGTQVRIEHNTIINGAPQSQATAAIYIAPDDGHQNDRIITNNLLGGGAYVIYGGDSTATNIVVTNNKITTQVTANGGYFGVRAYWQAGNAGNVWTGNTWYDGPNQGNAAP